MARLKVRVTPGARKNEIIEWSQDRLRLKIASPPVEGKANQALIAFIAKSLGLKRRQVILISGEKSREKTLEIPDLSFLEIKKKLI